MDTVTPNFELANARLADLSERELESYLCHHGPRRYDRNELRTIIAANMQPDIYPERINVYLALLNALQFEGFAPGPSPDRRMDESTNFGQPRFWTSYEWTLGGRRPSVRGRRTSMNWQLL